MPSKTSTKDSKPLPLSDTLHDLALLRVSGVDLSVLVPSSSDATSTDTDVGRSVQRSHDFIQSARSALKLRDTETVDAEGKRLDAVRIQLDEISPRSFQVVFGQSIGNSATELKVLIPNLSANSARKIFSFDNVDVLNLDVHSGSTLRVMTFFNPVGQGLLSYAMARNIVL
ncbi:uncharacterized protein ARMOST_00534 [Armillaria ostoyae]|uniref:Uncharacterized protein n=1 Tax=Armillaria ostoyae TaxID=47428 RepID=A0A284QLF1_ARMOS|nr:uncharacterized protein ARMOST_00534 [Armillaria ostoyae]